MSGDWRGGEYASAANHHREFDDWFLERCPPAAGDTVVDLGSGSGEFTARIAALASEGDVVGVEPDPSMLESARRHRIPNLSFLQGSAEDLDSVLEHASVDMVISRAVLHWIPLASYPRVFEAVFNVLRPGGLFHSESAGAGNGPVMLELVDDLAARFGIPAPARFPDAGVVFDIVENTGFSIPAEGVRTIAQRRRFSEEQMVGFLRTQATVLLTRDSDEERSAAIVDAALANLERMRRSDGTFDQTFVRLEILASRPM